MHTLIAPTAVEKNGMDTSPIPGVFDRSSMVSPTSYLTELLRQAEEIIRGRSAPDTSITA